MKKIVISQSALRLAALTIVGSAVSCGIWEKTKPGDRGVLGEGQVSNGNAEVPQPPLTDINNSSSSKPEVLSPKSQESGLICEAYLKRSNLPIYRDYVQASPMENPLIEDIPPVLEKEDELFRPFFKLMESRVSEVSPLTPEIFTLAKNAMIAAHKFIYVFNWQPNYPRADHAAGEMNWVPSVPPAAEQINNWKMERTGTNWVASYSRDRETKMIFSQGDFDANNQDRCIIFVNGNLTAKTIKYCTIIASGNVHVDSLIDSSVMAGGEVTGSVPQYEVYINNNKGAVAASSDKLVKDPKIAQGYFYSLSKPEVLRHISNYHQGPESTRYSFRDAYFFEKKHLVVNNVTGRWDICTGLQMNGGAGWQECHDVRDFKRYSARKISFRDGSFIKLGGKDLKFEVYDQNAKLVSSIDIAKYSKLFSSSIKVESDEYKSYLYDAYPSAKASISSSQGNFLFESLYNQLGKKCNSEISLTQRIFSYSTTCADGYKYKEEFNIADRINLLDRGKIVFHELANMGALSSCDNLPDDVFNVIEVNDKAKLFNIEFDNVMADFPKQHDYNLCDTQYCRNYREALRSLFQSVKIKSVFYKEEISSLRAKSYDGSNLVSLEFTGFHLTKRVTPAYDQYAPPLVEYFYPEYYFIYDSDWPSIKLFLSKIGAHFDTFDDQT